MVKIVVNDWMTSMGTVALMRLDPEKKFIQADANSLEVSVDWLKDLSETLFQYLLNQYSVATRETQALKKLTMTLEKNASDSAKYKDYAKWLNDRVKSSVDRVKKYFPELNEELQAIVVVLKEHIERQQFKEINQQIVALQQIFQQPAIDKKLTLNWVKATMLAPAAGQASFLNVAKNGLAYTEQMAIFEKDYIAPLVWELQLRDNWEKNDEKEIEALFELDDKPLYASKWEKEKKKSKLSWCEWLELLPACTLLEDQWGTMMFEEMHFVPLGMSMSNAYNYAWDGDIQSTQSISALAKLLLLISPIGAYRYRRPSKGEMINVFGFLYSESSCRKTLMLNNQLANSMQSDVKFSDALKDSFSKLRELENKRQEAAVLIEWDTDYKAKKTFLEYKSLHADFVNYIMDEKSNITSNIYPFEFREEVVRAALNNLDSKHLITREMRRIMNDTAIKKFTSSLRNALLMREYLIVLKEGKEMQSEKTITLRMYNLGFAISKKLGGGRKENQDGSYQASNEKKLTSVAYRLLNAAKAGNRQLFFDTAVRLHISAGVNISSNFTKALDPSTSDKEFATIALAFIAGLIPADVKNDEMEIEGV